ncbi:MAG: class I SAM-dependent methyltransferase [Dissulfurispiraceae bacterium]
MIQKIFRSLKYLFACPQYSLLYFFGNQDEVIHLVTGKAYEELAVLKDAIGVHSDFARELSEKTFEITSEDFRLTADHHFIYTLTRLLKPKLVLETGVFDGYFTACFLKGLHDNFKREGIEGKLVSIDLPPFAAIKESTDKMARTRLPEGYGPGWVIPDYLRSRWRLHLGDSKLLLPSILREAGEVSFFFHDSLHTYAHMMFEFECVWPFLETGSVLMSHDVHWNRAFQDFSIKYSQRDLVAHGFGIIRKRTPIENK